MRHFAVSLIVHREKIERLSASNILAADEADRSGDLRTTIEYASGARHTIRLWNEFRVWGLGSRRLREGEGWGKG